MIFCHYRHTIITFHVQHCVCIKWMTFVSLCYIQTNNTNVNKENCRSTSEYTVDNLVLRYCKISLRDTSHGHKDNGRVTIWNGKDSTMYIFHVSWWCNIILTSQSWNVFTIGLRYGPRQANLVLIAYASSEGSGEPAHPRSLARTFAARSYKQWVKRNLQTESQIPGPSEWLGMRS